MIFQIQQLYFAIFKKTTFAFVQIEKGSVSPRKIGRCGLLCISVEKQYYPNQNKKHLFQTYNFFKVNQLWYNSGTLKNMN